MLPTKTTLTAGSLAWLTTIHAGRAAQEPIAEIQVTNDGAWTKMLAKRLREWTDFEIHLRGKLGKS